MSHNQYSNYPCSFVGAGPTTLNLTQFDECALEPGSSIDEIMLPGSLTRAANMVASAAPKARIRLPDLATFFGTVSPTVGFKCTSGATFRFQQRADGGTFTGGSSNLTVTSALGHLYPDTLSAAQGQPASLEAIYCALWDGSTNPLVPNATQSFSGAPTPAFGSKFWLGPVYINGVLIEGLTKSSVNFGVGFETIPTDGDPFPRKGLIRVQKPSITLSFRRADVAPGTISSLFGAAAAGTVAVYFYRGLNNSTRDFGQSTHCKVSMATGFLRPDDLGAAGEEDGTFNVTFLPTAALAISVASAVP